MRSKVGTEVWKVGKERFKGLLTTMQKENEYGQCIVCYRGHCWSEEVVLHKIVFFCVSSLVLNVEVLEL